MIAESQEPIPAHQGREVVVAAGGMAGARGRVVNSRRNVRKGGKGPPYTVFVLELDGGCLVDVPAGLCLILFGPAGRPCHRHDWTQTAVFAMLSTGAWREVVTCRRCGLRLYRPLPPGEPHDRQSGS